MHKLRHKDEEEQAKDLESQPTEHKILSQLNARSSNGGSCHLGDKTRNVDDHIEFGQLSDSDDAVACCIEAANETSERHVHCCRNEECRAEDEHKLYEVGTAVANVAMGPRTAVVAKCFA